MKLLLVLVLLQDLLIRVWQSQLLEVVAEANAGPLGGVKHLVEGGHRRLRLRQGAAVLGQNMEFCIFASRANQYKKQNSSRTISHGCVR